MKYLLWIILMVATIIGAIINAVHGDAAMTTLCCTAYLVTVMELRGDRDG